MRVENNTIRLERHFDGAVEEKDGRPRKRRLDGVEEDVLCVANRQDDGDK